MNDQGDSVELIDKATALKDSTANQKEETADSNGSDQSNVVLVNDTNEKQINDKPNETKDNSNEQRESVIVQPSRIPTIKATKSDKSTDDNEENDDKQVDDESNSEQSPKEPQPKDERPKFLCESKFTASVINNLFNSVTKQEPVNSTVKLRPSVLRISEQTGNEKADTANKEEQTKPMNQFKFAPLTDNRKPLFGSLNSSITSSSTAVPTSSFSSLNSSKNSFLTNNGDNKTTPPTTTPNYFTENLFQAASQSTSDNSPESTSTFAISSNNESAGFVFGQNLQDRVTNIAEKPKLSSTASAESNTSQASDLSSTSAVASSTANNQANIPEKRKFDNITGEEEETNVIHIYCKLFHWDSKTSAWKERGKGNLRLNDKYEDRTSSRLIMRTAGSFKLILNCLIQSGMKFELTNESSCIRFSNVDGIYLIKGKQLDIEQIYLLIEQRLKTLPKKSRGELSKEEDESLEMEEKLKLNKDEDNVEENDSLNTSNDQESSIKSEETNKNEDDNEDKEEDDDQEYEDVNEEVEEEVKVENSKDDKKDEIRADKVEETNQES